MRLKMADVLPDSIGFFCLTSSVSTAGGKLIFSQTGVPDVGICQSASGVGAVGLFSQRSVCSASRPVSIVLLGWYQASEVPHKLMRLRTV
ncbi:hypothetical protein BaRGS_00010976 [Batillaria attramentaria]|uniref:Uncharacterized protein n=1 Tax=Batillaria attramentaria TaxID=370345 RepID=A0ABD0LEV5_9CAEN